MRDRAFGVEIECGYGGERPRHECNCSNCGWYEEDYYYEDDHGIQQAIDLLYKNPEVRHWADGDIHCDGSGVEIPSPVLRGQKGLSELNIVMKLLRENKFYVSGEDGLHVHHDAPEFVNNGDLTIDLVERWNENQELISNFVAASRRSGHGACPTWRDSDVEYLKNTVKSVGPSGQWHYYSPRGAINISSLREHGTIEIRQHEGTLDFDEAYAWIHFGQAFIDSVLNKRVVRCSDSAQLLKMIRVSEKSQRTLLAKAGIEVEQPQLAVA